MKILIISDTHDNLANLEKFLSWAHQNNYTQIIHCGDIASSETVDYLSKNFIGDCRLVFGNMDANYRQNIIALSNNWPNIKLCGEIGKWNLKNLKIAFCHQPETAKELGLSGDYHLVFYGHTHKPWVEKLLNGCQLINPGTLGGVFNRASFAVFDTDTNNLELKILELL